MKLKTMNAYFMRHGETNYNLRALCNADPSVDVHLTANGIKQAQSAAEKLKHLPLETIYVSELPRTRQTAEVINNTHRVQIKIAPELNDIDSGFEGKPVAEYFAAVGENRLTKCVNGGESVLEYKARVIPFLQALELSSFRNILVIAHEETLRIIDAYYRKLDDEEMMQRIFTNCEILGFDIPSGQKIEI